MYFVGFDIGASFVKAALVQNKEIIKSQFQETPKNIEDLVSLVVKIFKEITEGINREEIGGIGVGIAGDLDEKREAMLRSYNMEFLNGQPIKKLFEEKLAPYPIKLDHDVHCFLLAEKEIGAAKNFKNVFYLTLGTGIGGAWMVDGEIIYGAHGAAGEVGHTIVEMSQGFDFEEMASNKFIKKSLGFGSIEAIRRVQTGDKESARVLEQLGRNLGVGIANIINIFDPEAIILAGGIADAKEFILPGIKEGIAKFVISPAAKETEILFSQLGRFGGALGAALLFE